MQATLRVENILPPGLVETNGHIVTALGKSVITELTEAPGPQKTRPAKGRQRMAMDAGRQHLLIPPASVQLNFMPIREQAACEVGDVCFTPAAGGQNAFVAKCDVHDFLLDDLVSR